MRVNLPWEGVSVRRNELYQKARFDALRTETADEKSKDRIYLEVWIKIVEFDKVPSPDRRSILLDCGVLRAANCRLADIWCIVMLLPGIIVLVPRCRLRAFMYIMTASNWNILNTCFANFFRIWRRRAYGAAEASKTLVLTRTTTHARSELFYVSKCYLSICLSIHRIFSI